MEKADKFLTITLFFLLGIGAASFRLSVYNAVFIVFIIAFLAKYLIPKSENKSAYFILFLSIIPALSGFFYFHLYGNFASANRRLIFNKPIEFRGIITSEPKAYEKYQKFEIKPQSPYSGKAVVLSDIFPEYKYGDLIEVKGTIKDPENKLKMPTIFFPETKLISQGNGLWFKQKLIEFKHMLIGQFKIFLPPDSAALMSGLTFGYRSGFTQKFAKAMSSSGTTHIVALSGYNIAILVIAVSGIFLYFTSRKIAFYLTVLTIFLFVIMVGCEASIVRAAIMGFLVLLSGKLGRQYSLRNSIALTAVIMAVINPDIIKFDIGFQLSFLSLLGIIYLSPGIKNILKFREEDSGLLGWKENMATTLGAQLAVAPIIIHSFGNFSFTSVFANILILTFVPITMFFGFVLAMLGSISYYLGFTVSKISEVLLLYEINVIKLFAKLNLPIFSSFIFKLIFAIIYICLISYIIYINYIKQKKNERQI